MSITKVSQLTCDGCGHSELSESSDVTMARLQAMKSGWKFMAYQGLVVNGKARARQWDACKSCDLPTPEEVTELLGARQ